MFSSSVAGRRRVRIDDLKVRTVLHPAETDVRILTWCVSQPTEQHNYFVSTTSVINFKSSTTDISRSVSETFVRHSEDNKYTNRFQRTCKRHPVRVSIRDT